MQQGTPPLEAQSAGVVKGRLHSIRAEIARLDRLNPPLPLVFLLAMVALYVRAPELFFAPSLWAEDVDRFVEAFAKHGFASVFMALHGPGTTSSSSGSPPRRRWRSCRCSTPSPRSTSSRSWSWDSPA